MIQCELTSIFLLAPYPWNVNDGNHESTKSAILGRILALIVSRNLYNRCIIYNFATPYITRGKMELSYQTM